MRISSAGSTMCLKEQSNQLAILELGDPVNPRRVGVYLSPKEIGTFTQSGNVALVLAEGLHVVDLSAPATPRLLGRVEGLGTWGPLATAGAHAFVVVGSALAVINIDDPSRPREIARASLLEPSASLVLHGGYAYVLGSSLGPAWLQVFDISDPGRPGRVGGNSSLTGYGTR